MQANGSSVVALFFSFVLHSCSYALINLPVFVYGLLSSYYMNLKCRECRNPSPNANIIVAKLIIYKYKKQLNKIGG